VLCANKADLPLERWAVSREDFRVYATERGLAYYECSASSGLNITELFVALGREVLKNSKANLTKVEDSNKDNVVLFDSPANKNQKKSCC
jgi:GTPase SAR1 family protein